MPDTDMQSGRLAVISKSSTASPSAASFPSSGSMLSTANPRTDIVAAIDSGVPGTSTNSRSHETRIFMALGNDVRSSWRRELSEEPQVVFVEQADVVDAVLEHRDPLESHPECESRDLLGVVAD